MAGFEVSTYGRFWVSTEAALDSSIGRPTRRVILEVRFDYPTLAPMTMDDLDPVLALQHFDHRINVDRNRQLQPLDDRGV
jgi:hypothetical protein